ncbi:hypothetical protein F511_05436 [Dorcoceras hygrometricum]|uniref:Uncharacterized protein n=1 Tax=Dorcoceras hygrometricum TaxID=472368 RepID=A0A2Z7BFV6_9LAMI|nr:hypothetical protein F511_05436 [Dorcoceras hygrometricum]
MIFISHQLAPSVGTKKESENAANEEQSAIVENTDVQEEADDTGTSINHRKTLNLVHYFYSGNLPSALLGNLPLPCSGLEYVIFPSSCWDKSPHPTRASLLILLGQVSSSYSGKSPHPAGASLLILLGQVSSSCSGKSPHPTRASLLILLGQVSSSCWDKPSHPPDLRPTRVVMCNSLVENR